MIYISPSPNTNSPSDWTVGNRGRDSFGDFVRSPISPVEIVCMLAEVGAWGVNLHDNDLVPIDATCAESDAIIRNFKKACKESGLVVPMATVSLFFHPNLPRWCFHRKRSRSPGVRPAKNDARDGSRSGVGR